MMKMRYVLFFVLAAIAFGCKDKEEAPKGKYEHGVFIVNEGAFGKANGTVTFYNSSSSEAEQNILKSVTGFAGDVAQSITFKDDKVYLVLNGDSKIQIADANTFEIQSTIANSDIVTPRYLEVINDKAYISVWGPYDANYSLIDSYVLVYDLKTNSIIKKINTDEGTDNLLYNGNYLFAANYNYGASKTLAVINPADNSLVKQIELFAGPTGMIMDGNGKLWVACVGGYGATSGKLFRINSSTLAIEATISITGKLDVDIAASPDKQTILYTVNKSVFQISSTATQQASQPLFTTNVTNLYSFNVDPGTGDIWIGDAPSFTLPGKTYVYSSSGILKTSFDVGIGPGQFMFK